MPLSFPGADPAWETPLLQLLCAVCSAAAAAAVLLSAAIFARHRALACSLASLKARDEVTEGLSDASAAGNDDMAGLCWSGLSYWAPNGFPILHNVTGYLNPGQTMAIMGPSGSGKTTMLDLLAGRRDDEGTQSGRILFNGEERSKRGE